MTSPKKNSKSDSKNLKHDDKGHSSKKIHIDPDDEFDIEDDLIIDDEDKDLPPIIDGDFDELDDEEIDKGFDSKRHYEDILGADDDDDED